MKTFETYFGLEFGEEFPLDPKTRRQLAKLRLLILRLVLKKQSVLYETLINGHQLIYYWNFSRKN